MTPQIRTMQPVGEELAIAWSDGHESYLGFETLRRGCPCAVCSGEPDARGRVVKPDVSYAPDSFRLAAWGMVGNYGFQPRWADGHNTGIYSLDYLRRLDPSAPPFPFDPPAPQAV